MMPTPYVSIAIVCALPQTAAATENGPGIGCQRTGSIGGWIGRLD